MSVHGNPAALRRGVWDAGEASFIVRTFCDMYGALSADVAVDVEHGGWYVTWDSPEEVRTYSVHETSGPQAIVFDQL